MQNNILLYTLSVAKKYIFNSKRDGAIFISSSLTTVFTTVLLPYLLGYYIDDVILKKNSHLLYTTATLIILSIVIGHLSSYISAIYSTKIHGNAYITYNLDILSHIQSLPLTFFRDKDSAYITKRINDDTEEVISFILDNFVNLTLDITVIMIIVSILLVKYHPLLPFTFVAAVALDIFIYFYYRKLIYSISYEKKELQNDYFASLNENISKIHFIKSQVINKLMHGTLANKFHVLLQSFIKFTKINYSYILLSKFIRRVSIVIVLIICGNSILSDEISVGDFVSSVTYFMFGFSCLDNFPELAKKWQNVSVSIDRIKTILQHAVERNGVATLDSIHSISMKNVNYYNDNDSNVLDNFTYTFNKGYTYAITGNNGSGKSTLLSVIIGLLKIDSGEVLYNNLPASEMNTIKLRDNHISYCDQSDIFLNMSVKQNLLLNSTNCDYKYLNTLIEAFNLESRLGMDISQNGNPVDIKQLSGGEKRKISIIRTLIKDSSIYIFDEPTNALDSHGIDTFKDIIKKLKANKIVILVTHDQSIVKFADHALEL